MAKLLVIDDEKIIRERLKKLLDLDGHRTYTAEDGQKGLEIFHKEKPEIVLVDIKMPGMDGIEVLKKIKEQAKVTEVIIITGHGGVDTAIQALREGAFGYIQKPIEYDELEIEIKRALEKQEMEKRLDEYVHNIEVAYAELDQIFNTAGGGMCVVDKDFNVLRINEAFASLSGKSEAQGVGKKCYEGFPGHACHTGQCPLSRILGGEERVECEVEKERSDGTKIPCIVTATPFREPDGKLIGIVEDYRDLTEHKRAEEQRVQREKLQGVIEMAGAVCHELNQPMQAVSGYSELLLADMAEDNPLYEDISMIKEQIVRMGKITRKLMRITRYETKDYVFEGKKIIDIDKASGAAK